MSLSTPFSRLLADAPLFRLLLPFMVGIWMGEIGADYLMGYEWGLYVAAIGIIIFLFIVEFKKHASFLGGVLFLALLNVVAALLGCAMLLSTRSTLVIEWPDEERSYRAEVVEPVSHQGKVAQVVVKLHGDDYGGQKVRLALVDNQTQSIFPGDVLLFNAKISSPKNYGNPEEFDYAQWLRRRGISGMAYCGGDKWGIHTCNEGRSLAQRMLRFRDEMVAKYSDYFEGSSFAVLSALTLGDKRQLDTSTRNLFSEGGVSHVLALSGLHLGILFSIYQFLILGVCRRRNTYLFLSLLGVVGLWAFVLLAGSPVSLIRAAVMFTIMQLCSCLRRDSMSTNNLALAAFILLFINPPTLFDVGFQLSCISVLFILLLMPHLPVPKWVASYRWLLALYKLLAVSLCAQLGTAPLVAYYFHTFPMYGLLANVFVVPMVYVILVGAILFFLLPFGREVIAALLNFSLEVIETVLECISAFPGAVWNLFPDGVEVILYYVVFLTLIYYFFTRRAKYIYVLSFFVAFSGIYGMVKNNFEQIGPTLIVYNLRTATAVHCIASAERSYMWTPDSLQADSALRYVKQNFWEKKDLEAPNRLLNSYGEPEVVMKAGIISFYGKRIAIPESGMLKVVPDRPIQVDYLLLSGRKQHNFPQALSFYAPKQIILDSSLPPSRAERYTEIAGKMGIAVYDIRKEGALVCPLE